MLFQEVKSVEKKVGFNSLEMKKSDVPVINIYLGFGFFQKNNEVSNNEVDVPELLDVGVHSYSDMK